MITEQIKDIDGIGKVILRKNSRAKNLRISVSPAKGIVVTMPFHVPTVLGMTFLKARKDWILSTLEKQRRKPESPDGDRLTPVIDARNLEGCRKKAAETLLPKISAAAAEKGFRFNRIFFKNNRSNWGSCSTKGNINLNIRLIFLPDRLQNFVILHELCHLRHPDHGKDFHALLNGFCEGQEKELSNELRRWKIQ